VRNRLEGIATEELLLLQAVEAMEGQHHSARLYDLVIAVLAAYGLDIDTPDYETSPQFLQLESVADKRKHEVGYWAKDRLNGDRSRLNQRSKSLLVILAGQCDEIRMPKTNEIDHHCMSAGEAACFQLASYDLLAPANRGGCLTPAGKEASAVALTIGFNPISHFMFEGMT
jgi:hypothetical protein